MTKPTQEVARVLLADPARKMYGLQIAEEAGLLPGTIYPILRRFEDYGWVTSGWEDINEQVEGRPRRRYYTVTASGLPAVRQALAEAAARQRRAGVTRRREQPGW
jgi:DNA-binding PadR family transcriptional regulator